ALTEQAAATTAFRLVEIESQTGAHKAAISSKLRQAAAQFGVKSPTIILSHEFVPPADGKSAKAFMARRKTIGHAPKAIHTLPEQTKRPANAPLLVLVKGVQAVEYDQQLIVKPFESR